MERAPRRPSSEPKARRRGRANERSLMHLLVCAGIMSHLRVLLSERFLQRNPPGRFDIVTGFEHIGLWLRPVAALRLVESPPLDRTIRNSAREKAPRRSGIGVRRCARTGLRMGVSACGRLRVWAFLRVGVFACTGSVFGWPASDRHCIGGRASHQPGAHALNSAMASSTVTIVPKSAIVPTVHRACTRICSWRRSMRSFTPSMRSLNWRLCSSRRWLN